MNFIFKWLETWFNMYRAASSTAKPNFKQGFQVNGSDYSATELNTALGGGDPGTAGTVTASKAVIVDANKDIATFRNLTATTIKGSTTLQAGASGSVGVVNVYPATAASGYLSIGCADQATNNGTSLVLLSQSAARTISIPDAGGTSIVALDKAFACLTAAGAAHLPASASEVIITGGTKAIAAGALTAGNVIRFRAAVKVNAINATDTLTVRARIGAVTASLTGTVVASHISGATTAANDIVVLDGYIDMNSFSTPNMTMTGTGTGLGLLAGVAGVATPTLAPAFTLNTVNAVDLSITIQFSTNSGTNSATLHSFTHEIKAS